MKKGTDSKPHIGIFGRRNSGKSSLINVLVNQEIAIVSELPGTTTDPVKKSLEIFGIGPVVIIDTAGIDDTGVIGDKRKKKTLDTVGKVDCAILLISENLFGEFETHLIGLFHQNGLPFFIIHNKSDKDKLTGSTLEKIKKITGSEVVEFSCLLSENAETVINALKICIPETSYRFHSLIGDLVSANDMVVLVTPVDSEAPQGRMILPQVMTIRDALDNNCICIVLKETELGFFLQSTDIRPKIVITDSQAFSKVNTLLPPYIPLTGFSILFARLRGDFKNYLEGTPAIAKLHDGDRVLIMESCSHRVTCDDIGRFKLPKWINEFTKKELLFDFVSGQDIVPQDITKYALVIQCGGCMATKKQILNRTKTAVDAGIPITNYGMAIAFVHGIFDRAVAPFRI